MKTAAKMYPHVSTMDNLDINIAGVNHHLTQEFIEIEQTCTKHLHTESKTFDQLSEMFNSETILLTAEENETLSEHFKKVVAITVGRILSERLQDASFLKPLLDNHYDHPHKSINPKPAILFIKKPLYLHEIVNDEMMQICKEVQMDFLQLSAELVSDKESFLKDLDLIQKKNCDPLVRSAAEKRIHSAVLETGEYIGNL